MMKAKNTQNARAINKSLMLPYSLVISDTKSSDASRFTASRRKRYSIDCL